MKNENSKEDKNRRLAEWLGIFHDLMCGLLNGGLKCDCHGYHPDFYTSEDASALLLEKLGPQDIELMGHPVHKTTFRTVTISRFAARSIQITERDRKTAICEATLAYIESLAVQEKK